MFCLVVYYVLIPLSMVALVLFAICRYTNNGISDQSLGHNTKCHYLWDNAQVYTARVYASLENSPNTDPEAFFSFSQLLWQTEYNSTNSGPWNSYKNASVYIPDNMMPTFNNNLTLYAHMFIQKVENADTHSNSANNFIAHSAVNMVYLQPSSGTGISHTAEDSYEIVAKTNIRWSTVIDESLCYMKHPPCAINICSFLFGKAATQQTHVPLLSESKDNSKANALQPIFASNENTRHGKQRAYTTVVLSLSEAIPRDENQREQFCMPLHSPVYNSSANSLKPHKGNITSSPNRLPQSDHGSFSQKVASVLSWAFDSVAFLANTVVAAQF